MKQITVVAPDRKGLVSEITKLLGDGGFNIETLNAGRVGSMGVILLSVDRYDEALAALRDAGFPALTEDALVVKVKDEPGALARLSSRLADAGVNVRSLRIIRRVDGEGLVALSADDMDRAREILKDLLVH